MDDAGKITLLIGVAAAAAVLAIIWVVRHGRTVALERNESFQPSPDFKLLRQLAKGDGPGAKIAQKLIPAVTSPWGWKLVDSLEATDHGERRELLLSIKGLGTEAVTEVRPIVGDSFDPDYMNSSTQTTTDDCWVVTQDVADPEVGFRVDGQVALKAQVKVSTVDWWVLSCRECPVGQAVASDADRQIAGGKEHAEGWRATWGLKAPEQLRAQFEEGALDLWRRRMIDALNPYYKNNPDRCLAATGDAGHRFDEGTMESPDAPVGDALVVQPVSRGGVAQYGLCCPGGNPLLLAIVQTRPVEKVLR